MNPKELLCERILIFLHAFPIDGFLGSNAYLAAVLGEKESLISETLKEMIETGLIYRWLDRDLKVRVLSIYREGFFEKQLSKEKKESSKERKEIYIHKLLIITQSVLSVNDILLRNMSFPEIQLSQLSWRPRPPVNCREEKKERTVFEEEETVHTPAPKKEKIIVPGNIMEIINFWNNSGLKKCSVGTKTFGYAWDKINKAKSGKLFKNDPRMENRKYTSEEILLSIKNFALATLDPLYYPPPNTYVQKQYVSMPLSDFLYWPYSRKPETASLFYHYLENKPELLLNEVSLVEDTFPRITKMYKDFFIKEALAGVPPKRGISNRDENKFREGAKRTVEFFRDNKTKFLEYSIMGGMSAEKLANWVCESIIENRTPDEKVPLSPGFFCSDYTFDRRLPAYLKKQGIWE